MLSSDRRLASDVTQGAELPIWPIVEEDCYDHGAPLRGIVVEAVFPMMRIVIVGGGFAGVWCARMLRKKLSSDRYEIVVFSRENHLVFFPLLADVAGATITPDAVTVPLRQMLPGIRCRTEEVRRIDLAGSEVEYESYDGYLQRMSTDHTVIACGSTVNLGVVPGMADHALPLKSVEDAMALRFHIMRQLEKAEVCDDPERRRWYLSIAVVGGGFSGVEVAGQLNDLVRASVRFYRNFTADDVTMTLLHSRNHILPEVSPTLRKFARSKMEKAGIRIRLNTRVTAATAEGVELEDGTMIHGATIVCTIGTTMPQLVEGLDVAKERGRVLTDQDMRVRGLPNVWAIGDCAHIVNAYDNHVAPSTGQFAEREGRHAAENIIRVLEGQSTKPFCFKPLGQLCGIGERNAVAEIFGVRLSGFPAWWLWRTVYLFKSPSWSRRIKVAFDWTWDLLFPRDLTHPRTTLTQRIFRAHYRPGDYIFRKGDPPTNFYVVERGEVEVVRHDASGQPTEVLAVMGRGEFFGEIALIDDKPRLASVRARTPVEVLVMGKGAFSQLSGALTAFHNLLAQALRWRRPRWDPRLLQAWQDLERQPLSVFIEAVPARRLSPDSTLEEAIHLFDEHDVEFACVVDHAGILQGVVTRTELFEAFAQGKGSATKVHDFMLTQPVVVTPDQTSSMVGELMNKHDVDALPVVENKEIPRLIGVIRSERMLRYLMSLSTTGERSVR
jgi:NADH dehydrogenase